HRDLSVAPVEAEPPGRADHQVIGRRAGRQEGGCRSQVLLGEVRVEELPAERDAVGRERGRERPEAEEHGGGAGEPNRRAPKPTERSSAPQPSEPGAHQASDAYARQAEPAGEAEADVPLVVGWAPGDHT